MTEKQKCLKGDRFSIRDSNYYDWIHGGVYYLAKNEMKLYLRNVAVPDGLWLHEGSATVNKNDIVVSRNFLGKVVTVTIEFKNMVFDQLKY